MAVIRTVHRFTGFAHNGNNDYPQYGAASQPGEHQPGYAQPGYPQHDSWQGQGGYAGGQRPPAGGQPVYPPVGAGQRQQPYAGGYPQQGAYQRTPYQPYGQPPKKNTGKIIAIVVSIVVALALIGVLVWALTSKGGDGKNGKGAERRFEQQEQRGLHRGSARRLERKLRRRLLRLHQQGLPAEEAGAGQKEAGAAAGTRQLQEEVRRLKLV